MAAGRYVLLEFDDAAQAKAYVTKINGAYGVSIKPEAKVRVRALWAKPALFCECSGAEKGANPYRRGEKSGWWIHAACGRPNRVWARGNHWFSAIGRNLLPGNTDYTPSGWGIDRSPTRATTDIMPTLESHAPGMAPDSRADARKRRAAARRAARAAV